MSKQYFKEVNIGKLVLKNPIVCASGTAGFLEDLRGLVDFKYIGAGITKTLTVEPRPGNQGRRIAECACGALNAIGLENPGIEAFLKEVNPLLSKLPFPVIISVAAKSVDEFSILGERIQAEKTIDAVELNLSCPNVKGKIIAQYPEEVEKAVATFKALYKGPLIVKLTPEVTDITETAKAAQAAGADALDLVNTFLGIAFDIRTQKPLLGNVTGGYSGKGIKPIALCKVWKTAQALDIDIIGGGGICDWNDAAEFFIAGAKAVSIGTEHFINPAASKEIVEGLYGYMKKNKIKKMGMLELVK